LISEQSLATFSGITRYQLICDPPKAQSKIPFVVISLQNQ